MVPTELPDDVAALKAMVITAHEEAVAAKSTAGYFKHRAEVAESALADIEQQLAALKRQRFGRRAERVADGQVSLLGEATHPEEALSEAKAATEGENPPPIKPRRRSKHGRRRLPAHLPRMKVTSGATGPTACTCCGEDLTVIGTDVSERLEYIPGHFVVFECTSIKRACQRCPGEGVFTQPAPIFGLDRALPADGLVARVITDKYADHIPLTRQSRRFAGEAGVDLPVSTLSGWRVSVSTSTSGPPEPGPRARWARPSPTPGTSGTRWSSSSQTARCHLTTTHPRGSFVARSLAARTGCSPGPRAVHRPPPHASPLSAAVSWSESIRTSTSAMCCGAVLLARLWARATHGVARHGLLPDETPDRLKDLTPRAWAARYGPTVSE